MNTSYIFDKKNNYTNFRHFPGRPATMTFLHELFQWVIGHEDMVSKN